MVVWKFALTEPGSDGLARVEMPYGAYPFSVGLQDEEIVVWALVDEGELPRKLHRFAVVNTGRSVPEIALRFLGTVTVDEPLGRVVWHVWSCS